jgi:hypothetical protein
MISRITQGPSSFIRRLASINRLGQIIHGMNIEVPDGVLIIGRQQWQSVVVAAIQVFQSHQTRPSSASVRRGTAGPRASIVNTRRPLDRFGIARQPQCPTGGHRCSNRIWISESLSGRSSWTKPMREKNCGYRAARFSIPGMPMSTMPNPFSSKIDRSPHLRCKIKTEVCCYQ